MNIAVLKASGNGYFFRPDSTLNHAWYDYYCPDGVSALTAVPCIYTKIIKAGKCVSERFATRYFNSFAYGCLLSDANLSVPEPVAGTMDFTSVMDMEMAPLANLPESRFTVELNGQVIFATDKPLNAKMFIDALTQITRLATLRIGDVIAIELEPGVAVHQGDSLTLCYAGASHSIKIL
ncbi:MAG: hypothetical protein J5693_02935 [Bacteroidales bacterium]|nr:hypothetical protein [Bacteroidales bacterium]